MVPRSDGRAYDVEPVVNPANCTSCGICAGSCPTSTPFRRAVPIQPGIELPDRTIAALRDELVVEHAGNGPHILVFGCETSNVGELQQHGSHVIELPCVGMLPPSFVDFVLARHHADGVMIAGCAQGDCFHRLGNEWTVARMAGERDPYLRRRVDKRRLSLNWLPRDAARRRHKAFEAFRDAVREIDDA